MALAGNEWRERRNDSARGERARASIVEEIEANRTATLYGKIMESGVPGVAFPAWRPTTTT